MQKSLQLHSRLSLAKNGSSRWLTKHPKRAYMRQQTQQKYKIDAAAESVSMNNMYIWSPGCQLKDF